MLLTKQKRARSKLLCSVKARASALPVSVLAGAHDHEKQLAVVDAVEWAAERWVSRELVAPDAADPRPAHAARLITALIYLDPRFQRLDPAFVIEVVDRVASSVSAGDPEGGSDAKAAATSLMVEVGAFRR